MNNLNQTLQKFNYNTKNINENQIEVDLKNNLIVTVDLNENKEVYSTNYHLKGFNWLTGSIPMSLEKSVSYNFTLIFVVIIIYLVLGAFNLYVLPLIFPILLGIILVIGYLFYFKKVIIFENKLTAILLN